MRIIRAKDRHFADFNWLQTYWLFSFAEYYDPDNIQFGALRVVNDDVVQPHKGFGTHPHEEMEIITIVLEGEVTHQDSLETKAVIQAGDVQRMSAGTGIRHSEFNLGNEPAHFYQIWIYPDESGIEPSYGQKSFKGVDRTNYLLPVASGQGLPDVVSFHTDATIYLSELTPLSTITHTADGSRRVFIYVTEGEIEIAGARLYPKDQARIDPEGSISLTAISQASLLLIDVPSCRGWGYDAATLQGESAS